MAKERDCWAEWLAERRYGGDADVRERFAKTLAEKRDRVLDRAELGEGDVLLDVGCGEGLIGFGALDRGAASVIFSDISQDVLDVCEQAAGDLRVRDRCRFLRAPADDLTGMDDGSVDVVATRSVLIYVDEKAAAFREYARVLRSGGRVSLLEPINRFARTGADTWAGYDLSAIPAVSQKIRAVYEELQPLETDPMLNFDERDLISLAEHAGFFPIRLYLEAEISPLDARSWNGFLNQAGNPRIPTIGEVITAVLTQKERDQFAAHVRPLVEEGRGTWRMAEAHLIAIKP